MSFFKPVLVGIAFILLILLIGMCCLSCIRQLCLKIIDATFRKEVLLAQREKGGIVGTWLIEKGHGSIDPLYQENSVLS